MAKNNVRRKWVNSSDLKGNKPTHHLSRFDFDMFAKNLITFSNPIYSGLPNQHESEAQKARAQFLRAMDEMELLRNQLTNIDYLSIATDWDRIKDYLNKKLKLTDRKLPTKKVGRPQVNGRIAFILLSALEAVKGDRESVNRIGLFIAQNGPFHRKVDKKYGEGTFLSLRVPAVNRDEIGYERWEAHVKPQLWPAAEKFTLADRYYQKLNSQKKRLVFARMLKRAHRVGFTDLELSEIETSPYQL